MLAARKGPKRRATRLRDAERTRERLLQAASREIYRSGFQSASLDTILAVAGVTRGALYYHFDSKEALGHAVIEEISMVRCGNGSNIELFQYTAPDQAKTPPRNSDIGGHHIALYVDDIDKAAAYLKEKNVKTMQGPIPITEGPAAGQSILYFLTPWGLQMELISYPKGMAYAKDSKSPLWLTTEPQK